jgi:hypothetical protein
MNRRIIILVVVIVIAIFAGWALLYEGEFKVEFGDSEKTRSEFTSILERRGVAYSIEKDHLDRVWVVPDQSKRKEYEAAVEEWS